MEETMAPPTNSLTQICLQLGTYSSIPHQSLTLLTNPDLIPVLSPPYPPLSSPPLYTGPILLNFFFFSSNFFLFFTRGFLTSFFAPNPYFSQSHTQSLSFH